jgi:hypothetical protein
MIQCYIAVTYRMIALVDGLEKGVRSLVGECRGRTHSTEKKNLTSRERKSKINRTKKLFTLA